MRHGQGRSGVMVVRGEPGVRKSALLNYVVKQTSGFRVISTSGVESEMELPFASLHQVCAPLLRYHEDRRAPGGSGRVATIPHFVRLDFAYVSQTLFYLMAGLMAAAGVVAMLGLRPGRQQELSEAKRGAPDEALEVARALTIQSVKGAGV